jgi:hypothetical protein
MQLTEYRICLPFSVEEVNICIFFVGFQVSIKPGLIYSAKLIGKKPNDYKLMKKSLFLKNLIYNFF